MSAVASCAPSAAGAMASSSGLTPHSKVRVTGTAISAIIAAHPDVNAGATGVVLTPMASEPAAAHGDGVPPAAVRGCREMNRTQGRRDD